MKTLFLDLAHHDGIVAAVTTEATIAAKPVDRRLRDDGLLPLIEETLQAAAWAAEDLTHVGVVTGPGGFTSLRVAVAAANALAWERKIPLLPIHGSDLQRARAEADDLLWLHSTRQDQLFVRGFGALEPLWPDACLATLADVLERAPKGIVTAGELIPAHAAALAPHNLQPATLRKIEVVLPALLQTAAPTTAPIDPWYGRGF